MSELIPVTGLPVATNDRRAERLGYGTGWLSGALPLGMQVDPLFVQFVTIFEEVASTLRSGADSVSYAADVDVTAPEMVRYLGAWVCVVAVNEELTTIHQREIVKAMGADARPARHGRGDPHGALGAHPWRGRGRRRRRGVQVRPGAAGAPAG